MLHILSNKELEDTLIMYAILQTAIEILKSRDETIGVFLTM